MSEEYKYQCKKCNYNCNTESQWKKHISTEKHKTGKSKIRSDKIYPCKCEKCEHIASCSGNLKQHILNFHSTKEERKIGYKYYCECCDYGTQAKKFYENHEKSKKHIMLLKINN
jgi:hypothetical protein